MADNKQQTEAQTKTEALQFTEKMENLKQYFAASPLFPAVEYSS